MCFEVGDEDVWGQKAQVLSAVNEVDVVCQNVVFDNHGFSIEFKINLNSVGRSVVFSRNNWRRKQPVEIESASVECVIGGFGGTFTFIEHFAGIATERAPLNFVDSLVASQEE